jgi:hypothetical protein
MKIFNNPIVVGGLAVLALFLVLRNTMGPLGGRKVSGQPALSAQRTPAAAVTKQTNQVKPEMAAAQQTEQPVLAAPEFPVNTAQIEPHLERWTTSPKRDPFQVTVGEHAPPRAEDVLELTAVWRQARSQLAVVNNQILGKGDSILGFTIDIIEADSIWLQGPRGAENLKFKSAVQQNNNSPEPVANKENIQQRAPAISRASR